MPRYVTVTPASVRSVAATLTARTVAVSRRYLFSSAARANIVAARTIAAALSRGRTALVPVRAVRTVVADVVARRALAVGVMGDRLVFAGLGAVRTLAALVSAGRSAFAGMVRRRPGAGTVSAARVVAASGARGRVTFASIFGARTVDVAPLTTRLGIPGVVLDSNAATLTDSSGGNVESTEVFIRGVVIDSDAATVTDSAGADIESDAVYPATSYLRWRVMYPVMAGARVIAATPRTLRFLSVYILGTKTAIVAAPLALRRLAAAFVADFTVPRFTAGLRRKSSIAAGVSAGRTVDVATYTTRVEVTNGVEDSAGQTVTDSSGSQLVSLQAYFAGSVEDSAGDGVTDSSGGTITSDASFTTTSYLRWRVAESPIIGVRVITAAPAARRPLAAVETGGRQISGTLFNLAATTDSSGDTITDDTSSIINGLI